MYYPEYSLKASKVPILSKTQINRIGENFVEDFCPDAMLHPQEIDVDRFLSNYLGLTLDYKDLSHCCLYLGMTVFEDTDYVPVFNFEKWCAEYISASSGTVIIDNSLLEDCQEHRYRFTALHEAAHSILHAQYFSYLLAANKGSKYSIPIIQCRANTINHSQYSGFKTDADWMEWQADALSSALLMPEHMVRQVVKSACRHSLNVNAGMEATAEVFNVSTAAAFYRLKSLGLIPNQR